MNANRVSMERIVDYFKVKSQNFLGETKEDHKEP